MVALLATPLLALPVSAAVEPEVTLNNTDPSISYAGPWWHAGGREGNHLGDVQVVGTNGASFEFTFTGIGIDYVSETNVDMGEVDLYLDGVFQKTVQCHAATRTRGAVVFRALGLAAGTHTLKGVKKSGDWMLLDALTVYNDGPMTVTHASSDPAGDVRVTFNQSVDPATATDPSHYLLTPGTGIQRAVVGADRRSVTLTPAQPVMSGAYTLNVTGVRNAIGTRQVDPATVIFHAAGGLQARYRLDGNAADDLGGPTGTLSGGATWGAGRDGQGLTLDGTGHADLGTQSFGENFALEAWIKPDTTAGRQTIAAQGGLWFGVQDQQLSFELCEAAQCSNLTMAYLPAARWSHVAISRTGSQLVLYIDGLDMRATTTAITPSPSTAPLRIGSGFKGAIDDVRIYGYALTEPQIRAHFAEYADTAFTLAATNGRLTATFAHPERVTPAAGDFRAFVKVGPDMRIGLPLTGFTYAAGQATLAFAPLTRRAVTQDVAVTLVYGAMRTNAAFTLAAAADQLPVAAKVKITGTARAREMLAASYTYIDPDGDAEGPSTYRWLAATSAAGPYTPVEGAHERTLFLTPAMAGKVVKVEVTPIDKRHGVGRPVTSAATSAIAPHAGNPRTDWFHDAGYGVSSHFLLDFLETENTGAEKWQPGENYDDFVNTFDVAAYADAIKETGAGFVIFTMGQHSMFVNGPNATYDLIIGQPAGVRTPTRDLVGEVADALTARGIKLVLYQVGFPGFRGSLNYYDQAAPHWPERWGDFEITRAFEQGPMRDNARPSQETMRKWESVIREWGERYGDELAGWVFDGFWFQSDWYADLSKRHNISSFVSAARAGNPNRLIASAGGDGSPYMDTTWGESYELPPKTDSSRWGGGTDWQQWARWTPLGARTNILAGWGSKGTHYDTAELAAYAKSVVDRNGVAIFDTRANRFGETDPAQLTQLRAVKALVRDGLVNDTDPAITYTGAWWRSSGRPGDYQGDVNVLGANGGSFEYTFTGTGIDYITEKNVDMGQVEILLDGVSQGIVDSYAPTKSTQQVLFSRTGLPAGQHTIKGIKRSGTWMLVDALRVQ